MKNLRCDICGAEMPEVFYEINGEYICADCVKNEYMRYTDDYITGLEEDGTFKEY